MGDWTPQPAWLISINPRGFPWRPGAEAAGTVQAPGRDSAGLAGAHLCSVEGSTASAQSNRSSASTQAASWAARGLG